MTYASGAAAALAMLAAGALSACESTQSLSDRLGKEGAKLAENKHISIAKQSNQVDVVGTTVLTDKNGSAVVVELRNQTDQNLAAVPIQIEAKDAKGKTVYQNNIKELDPELISVPLIPAGKTVDWVNDQVLASAPPKTVKVSVGQAAQTLPSVPDVTASAPKLENDPYSGVQATGSALNNTSEDLKDTFFFAVARKGGQVVAAGRGGIHHLRADGEKEGTYHIYFIGDPQGADVTVTPQPLLDQAGSPAPQAGSPAGTN